MAAGGDLRDRLGEALRLASADDVEIAARAGGAGYTRFAGNEVTQASTVDEVAVRVRVLRDGRLGTATTDALAPGRLAEAVRRAETLAAQAPRRPEHPGFSRSGEVRGPARAYDEATAAVVRTPGARTAVLGPALAALAQRGLAGAGLSAVQAFEEAVVTHGGTAALQASTLAKIEITALDGAGPGAVSGFAGDAGSAFARLDFADVAARAADIAARARDPIEVEPGAWDVVLEPRAVAEVMEWMASASLGSQGHEDGTGFLAGRDGERITGERVTLVDDGLDPDPLMLPTAFDAEGTPKRRVVLIDAGIARTPVWDRLSAARAGTVSTGHAAPLDDESGQGSAPTHLALAAGGDRVEDLLARVERGLWVTRFHYVNGLIDPRRAVMTGMTRDGLFLIEGGRVTRAVRNLRWTEPMLEAFARIDGLSAARRTIPRWWSPVGATVAPTMLVRGFHFTGKSR